MAETPQQAIVRLAQAQGVSLSALSRMLGRNVAYLQQFAARGSPRVLPERERARLAAFFGVDEALLGKPDGAHGAPVRIPYLAVAASAGPGAAIEGERLRRHEPIARDVLMRAGIAAGAASIIDVAGDSMAPTLLDGDRVLVDTAATRLGARSVLCVIRHDDALSLKRVSRHGDLVRIVSDNAAYPPREAPLAEVAVIGRARLLLRTL